MAEEFLERAYAEELDLADPLAEFRERLHTRRPLTVALDIAGLMREERAAR